MGCEGRARVKWKGRVRVCGEAIARRGEARLRDDECVGAQGEVRWLQRSYNSSQATVRDSWHITHTHTPPTTWQPSKRLLAVAWPIPPLACLLRTCRLPPKASGLSSSEEYPLIDMRVADESR